MIEGRVYTERLRSATSTLDQRGESSRNARNITPNAYILLTLNLTLHSIVLQWLALLTKCARSLSASCGDLSSRKGEGQLFGLHRRVKVPTFMRTIPRSQVDLLSVSPNLYIWDHQRRC